MVLLWGNCPLAVQRSCWLVYAIFILRSYIYIKIMEFFRGTFIFLKSKFTLAHLLLLLFLSFLFFFVYMTHGRYLVENGNKE